MELYKNLVKLELPEKGTGIVTKEFIKKGDTIARWFPHDRRTIDMVFDSLDALEARLETTDAENAKFLLNHSWPTPEGKVVVGANGSIFGCINHSNPPTVLHQFSESVWTTTANVDLNAGDELCFDYNLGSKYEVRKDEIMRRFLSICDRYGVEKRPSLGMTKPPCRVPKETLVHKKPLASLLPPRKDGAIDCDVWV